MKKILITGCAGFIGFHTTIKLLSEKNFIVGVDNINRYYDQKLKLDRLKLIKKNKNSKKFVFKKIDIYNSKDLNKICKKFKFDQIIHLAAQAGVRYSLKSPKTYTKSNIVGTFNILELAKNYNIKEIILASSSSVYGLNKKIPFKENHSTDNPKQFYAATKKSSEIMAYSYSNLYNIKVYVLRFFTVYGPWGRPDMALFKFVENIIKGKPIELYNSGNHSRDFSYIDNVVDFISSCSNKIKRKKSIYEIFNVGFGKQTKLMHFLDIIEKKLKRKAKIKYLKFQKGDMKDTYADTSKIKKFTKIKKTVKIEEGIANFIAWFKNYYLR